MKDARENWSSNLGFILAATGSAIGLGNLWKFPFITWKNDGGAFVLIYLICILAVGLPIMMAELLVGRKTQKSAVGAMREAMGPAWGWVGTWGVMAGFVILSYYAVVAGWSLFYLFQTLNWSLSGFPTNADMGGIFSGLAANGLLQTILSGAFMFFTVTVVFFGVHGGIEKTARLCLPALFVILLLLLFSALTMEGSGEALTFIFRPNFSELDTAAVLEALGHAFFTLSLGMGTMIVYGSYVARERSLVNAAGSIVILDTLIALIATIIMFSVIFTVPGMPEQVDGSSVGMLFISLPQLFYEVVPFGVVLAPAFYLLVALAALTSTISLLEVVVSYFIDQRKMDRSRATLLSGACIYFFTFLSAMSFGAVPWLSNLEVFDGKAGFFATMDHFASNWALPLGGLLITLGVGWFMPSKVTKYELVGSGSPRWFSYKAWLFSVRFIAPAAVAAILIAVIFFGKDFS
ncbi:MAG: sodium-dependent transporter [Longimicrobiales bacterium]|jgi:NSS family neurotransmitter:Na+ symporter|nr:sodium-dependent transporter [Longimicrobiales bacterium]|tara:strand:- start:99 stop:1487 length:1389 start_codon:yes stop_codon:yes gene_type:complete